MWKKLGKAFEEFALTYFAIIVLVLLTLSPIYIALMRTEQNRLFQSVYAYAQGKAQELEEKENFLFMNARNAYNDRKLQNICYSNSSFSEGTLFYNMSLLQTKLKLYFQNIKNVQEIIVYIPKYDYILTTRYIFRNRQHFYQSLQSENYPESDWLNIALESDSYITVTPDRFTDYIKNSEPEDVINYIYRFPMISDPKIKLLIIVSLDRSAVASDFLLSDLQSQGYVTITDKTGTQLVQSYSPDPKARQIQFTTSSGKQITISIDRSYFDNSRRSVLYLIMRNIGITLIFSACVALYFSWNRSRPIERVLAMIRKSSTSNSHIQELRELEDVVVNMASEIHQCNNSIRELDTIVNNSLLDRLFFGEFELPKIQDAFFQSYGPIPADCLTAVFRSHSPLSGYGTLKQLIQEEFSLLKIDYYVMHEQANTVYAILYPNPIAELEMTLSNIRTTQNLIIKVGLSNPISNLSQVKSSSQQALRRLNSGWNAPDIYVLSYTYSSKALHPPINLESMDMLSKALLTWDIHSMDRALDSVINTAQTSDLRSVELRQLFFSLRTIYSTVINQFILDSSKTHVAIERDFLLPNDLDIYSIESIQTTFHNLNNAIYDHQKQRLNQKTQSLEMGVLAYIEENYKDPNLCAASIAEHFHISEKYTYRLVKKHCGKTLNDRISFLRVQEGIRLLEQTNMSVSDIASSIGFTSYNSMYKVFMRVNGSAPSSYRKEK